jgi:hypothetical protein
VAAGATAASVCSPCQAATCSADAGDVGLRVFPLIVIPALFPTCAVATGPRYDTYFRPLQAMEHGFPVVTAWVEVTSHVPGLSPCAGPFAVGSHPTASNSFSLGMSRFHCPVCPETALYFELHVPCNFLVVFDGVGMHLFRQLRRCGAESAWRRGDIQLCGAA